MPTGLIPLLSSKEIKKALESRWGRTINTGWLVVDNIGEPQEYDGNKFLNLGVTSERLSPDEEIGLRLKISLPIPKSFPIDAFSVGNRIRSKKCKIYNKGQGYATISIIDASFAVDSAHANLCPYEAVEENDSD